MVSVSPSVKNSSRSGWRQAHYVSGLLLALFVGVHLLNHLLILVSPASHLAFMDAGRVVYRNAVVETVLLTAVGLQISSGLLLVRSVKRLTPSFWNRLHSGSGLYLAFFLLIHVSAVLAGRFIMHLDTNLYFGAAGLNRFPYLLFFVPYYSLAILAFFGHVAAVHRLKMTRTIASVSPLRQAQFILAVGAVLTLAILFGMTNGFSGLFIPTEYQTMTP